jgi:hypothetical protein
MDEVKAMTQAGETVGRAVGTGLRTLRRGAVQVAAAAEHKLAEGADTVREATAAPQAELARTSRRARKQLVRDAKQTGKELVKSAKQARKTARTAMAVPGDMFAAATAPRKRGRKWPWLLGIGVAVAGAGAVYVLKNKQDDQPQAEDEQPQAEAHTGKTPEPRHGADNNQQAVHRA